MGETAYEWALVIRARFDRVTVVKFEAPVTADQAWDDARRRMTLEDLEAVTEVRAIPTRSMELLTFTRAPH